MAAVATLVEATQNTIVYSIAEAGTAAATLQLNLPAQALANSAFLEAINDAFANQAAARTAFFENFDVIAYPQTATPAGATASPQLAFDPNVSAPAVANNFRLDTIALKAANGDTATIIVKIQLRHTITA